MKLERKRQNYHYLRQLFHLFPVGTYPCIYKFLESLEKCTLSPLQWLPLGRKKEMGRQWVAERDLSFICNVLVFKKETIFTFHWYH